MSDRKLRGMGAECIGGDLYLRHKLVGQYRGGQFVITEEGSKALDDVIDVQATEVKAEKPAKALKARAVKATPATPDDDPLAGLDL